MNSCYDGNQWPYGRHPNISPRGIVGSVSKGHNNHDCASSGRTSIDRSSGAHLLPTESKYTKAIWLWEAQHTLIPSSKRWQVPFKPFFQYLWLISRRSSADWIWHASASQDEECWSGKIEMSKRLRAAIHELLCTEIMRKACAIWRTFTQS